MSIRICCDVCGNKTTPCLGDADCNCGSGTQFRFQAKKHFFDGLFSRSAWVGIDLCGRCMCLIRGGYSIKHLAPVQGSSSTEKGD